MDTKFKEAAQAVETVTLDLGIAKTTYNNELKKGEGDHTPQQAGRAHRAGWLKKKE